MEFLCDDTKDKLPASALMYKLNKEILSFSAKFPEKLNFGNGLKQGFSKSESIKATAPRSP